MRRILIAFSAVLIAEGCAAAPHDPPASDASSAATVGAELVASWNRQVLEVAQAEDRFLTLKGLRTVTMMHLAMHDALNAIEPRYESYLDRPAEPEADPVVAAAVAASTVATNQYPDQEAWFEAELERWLPGTEPGPAVEAGVALGMSAAGAILAEREGDAWDGEAEYQWHPMAPGVYAEFQEHSGTPEGFIFGAGWAEAQPFTLEAPDQFRSPPPPAIDSDAYAQAFDEVKEVGAFESDARSADQAHLAMWWKDFVENSHNRLARQLAVEEGLDLWQAARLFALLNMSIYDAYVNVFDNKFHYNHWRPYTAIRWASNDGNPSTEQDAEWNNLHRHTYAFPSYPSAHGTACASAMTVMADTFGASRRVTMTTKSVDESGPLSDKIPIEPTTRTFDSFSAAAEECSLSRVYLGIHFRYDSVEGTRLGEKIGHHVVEGALAPIRP